MIIGTLENQMHRYLLGDLPEEEAIALEERLFSEDETFEEICEIENRLVDGYVRGRLSPPDREKFERHYLSSPLHQKRVRVAQELIKRADASLLVEEWGEQPLARKTSVKQPISWWSLAAAVVILLLSASLVWLSLERSRLRREVARMALAGEAQRGREQSRADQAALARNQNEEMKEALERLRAQSATPPPAPRGIFSFTLSPRLVRSQGETQSLSLPGTAGVVRLSMRVEQGDARTFQVVVREVGGPVIWRRSGLKPRLEQGDNKVVLDIPGGSLSPVDYILTLSVLDSAGARQEINRYFFRIIK